MVEALAGLYGWKVDKQKSIDDLCCLWSKDKHLDIKLGKREVVSWVNHYRYGNTKMIRKHVTDQELEVILDNPRTHTGKGHYINAKGKYIEPEAWYN